MLASSRLVTLIGPGGIGKTRLALESGAAIVDRFPDGVWLVELAPIPDPALVPATLAAELGVQDDPPHTVTEAIAAALRTRRLLVLLDNCEHMVHACADLAHALLRACAPGCASWLPAASH